jgi:hypothetical protein
MDGNVSGLEVIIEDRLLAPYGSFVASLPGSYQLILNIFVYVILISVYAIFVFEFCRFFSHKNIIKLNLSKYNTSTEPGKKKFYAALFYLLEYIIILPILVFFWFVVLSLMFLFLSEGQPISQILLISAAVIGAVRVTSYFNQNLSSDLAKLFPFTVLIIFLFSSNILEFPSVIGKLTGAKDLLPQIFLYLFFVVCFEIFIRVVYTITFLFKRPEEQEIEEVEEAVKEAQEG